MTRVRQKERAGVCVSRHRHHACVRAIDMRSARAARHKTTVRARATTACAVYDMREVACARACVRVRSVRQNGKKAH